MMKKTNLYLVPSKNYVDQLAHPGTTVIPTNDNFLEEVIFDKKNCCNFLYSEWILDILVLILVISLVSLEHMSEKGEGVISNHTFFCKFTQINA